MIAEDELPDENIFQADTQKQRVSTALMDIHLISFLNFSRSLSQIWDI